MALLDHNGESEFPFSKNKVFDALCIVIPSISGLKVESADRLIGRILVKDGVSLFDLSIVSCFLRIAAKFL